MNFELFDLLIKVIQPISTLAICTYLYLEKKSDKTNARITTLEANSAARHTEHESRIAGLEAASNSAPDHDDMQKIAASIASLETANHGQTEMLRSLTSQVNRINDWLIARAK